MRPIHKIGLLFFAALLLIPGALKSAHVFADHQHFYCDHSSEQHLHQQSIECDIFLIQQPSFVEVDLLHFEVLDQEEAFKSASSAYQFLIVHYGKSTTLRGPPMEI